VRQGHGPHRGGRLSHSLRRAKGLLVPVGLLGALVLAGPDNVSIFGSNVERVASDDRDVQVSTLFGSTTVVVPNGRQVDPGGFVLFGSVDCEAACSVTKGPVVHVRPFGAFGSVEIVTQAEYDADQRDDADEVDD
jgi:hypothetical protein